MLILSYFCAVLLMVCGLYLTCRSGFFQFRRLGLVFKTTFGSVIKKKDVNGFKAMSVALGSTIGIGNIVGVSAAILVGGPGAVFWMLISGFIGMIIKFAEIYLCVDEANGSKRQSGGPMYFLANRSKGLLRLSGPVFAAVCIVTSLFAGNLIQSKSIYRFADIGFDIGFLPITFVLIPITAFILLGKDKIYHNISSVLVPLMAVFYVLSALIIIIINYKNVPNALRLIFSSAFGFKEIGGGFSGAILSLVLRTGVMRGMFTHEAGMGSSPIAHCSAKNADPFSQGCWGVIEVFIDTVVVCMMTAVAVISSPIYLSNKITDPFDLICTIFCDVFGQFGLKALSISAICFAFASIIGWSFYGIKSVEFFGGNIILKRVYVIIFLLCIPFSSALRDSVVWLLTDIFNAMMLIPNTTALLIFAGDTVKPLKNIKSSLVFKKKMMYNQP